MAMHGSWVESKTSWVSLWVTAMWDVWSCFVCGGRVPWPYDTRVDYERRHRACIMRNALKSIVKRAAVALIFGTRVLMDSNIAHVG